jgi:hypothetical protein
VEKSEIIALMLAVHHDEGVRALPEFANAERLLKASPDLLAELEREKAYYDEHPDLLSGVRLPDPARSRIIDSLTAEILTDSRPAGRRISFSTQPLALAVAMTIFVGGLFFVIYRTGPPRTASVPSEAAPDESPFQAIQMYVADRIAEGLGELDMEDESPGTLLAHLREKGAPSTGKVSPRLAGLATMGCKVYSDPDGRDISLICFTTREEGMVHLFITRLEGLDPADVTGCCGTHPYAGRDTLTWHDEEHAFILVAHDQDQSLGGFSG